MNLSETARLLGAMASFDRRTVGDGDVIAWQAVLADAPFDDCLEAVKQHYAEEIAWMMPAHVRRAVRDMANQREMSARATPWAPGQYGVLKADAMPEVAGPVAESALTPPVRALLDSVRAMLPEGSREALMPRRVAWEREHTAYLRTRGAEPNPLYRPKAAGDPARDSDGFCNDTDCPAHPHGPARAPQGVEPSGWRQCPTCGGHTRDLPGHMAEYHPVAVPGYGAQGCDCPLPEKVSESCPLHGLKLEPAHEKPFKACGGSTPWGPCNLRAGHPVGPMFPGSNGHMVTENTEHECLMQDGRCLVKGHEHYLTEQERAEAYGHGHA